MASSQQKEFTYLPPGFEQEYNFSKQAFQKKYLSGVSETLVKEVFDGFDFQNYFAYKAFEMNSVKKAFVFTIFDHFNNKRLVNRRLKLVDTVYQFDLRMKSHFESYKCCLQEVEADKTITSSDCLYLLNDESLKLINWTREKMESILK